MDFKQMAQFQFMAIIQNRDRVTGILIYRAIRLIQRINDAQKFIKEFVSES